MENKITGICMSMLLIITGFVPVLATFISQSASATGHAQHISFDDTAFDLKMSFLMGLIGFPSLSACIIKDEQIIWSKGYGYYDFSEQKPATTDTNYLLASITKTIVGTALMQLYEEGLFDLDDNVNTFLPFEIQNPNFPNAPITFRMLLSHTSSLNTNDQQQYYWANFSGDPPFKFFPEPYLREFLLPDGIYYDPSVWSSKYRPGEYAMYANIGYDIISYLVEILSGVPFLEYCDTHIFSPLNMTNTDFNLSHLCINQVAIPYVRFVGRYYTINELGFILGEEWTPPDQYWRVRCYPAGGLYSTVSDLSHFLIAHMNDGVYKGTQLLQKETVKLMHDIQPGNQMKYGLAWMHELPLRGLSISGHSGGYPGVNTWMLYNETKDIGVIYLANGSPSSALPLGGWAVSRLILGSLITKEIFPVE